jgi:predicted MPP superfamily phosphohydrolase
LEITSQEVAMRGLSEEARGLTVAHLTDLHGGFGNTEAVFEEAIARVNAAQPDYVLFTGDYIDDHARHRDYPIQEVLRRFCAKRGVFGIFGNHDHRRGVVGTRHKLEQAGVQVLNNENVRLESGLYIAGVDDLEEGKPDIPRALEGIPTDSTAIVLSHNPRLIERINRNAFILSGHTHGGQITFPYILTGKVVCRVHLRCRQVAGWYTNGQARSYVSRGVGVTGEPFRLNCPAEVALFRLVPGE